MADNTLEIIEGLIETCSDGKTGYMEARECTSDPELKDFFGCQVLERATFARELESVANRLGNANRSSSMASKPHQTGFDIKQKTGGSDESLLECVEAGENNAVKRFQEALNSNLPPDVHEIVQKEAIRVFGAQKQVHIMREQYSSAQYRKAA